MTYFKRVMFNWKLTMVNFNLKKIKNQLQIKEFENAMVQLKNEIDQYKIQKVTNDSTIQQQEHQIQELQMTINQFQNKIEDDQPEKKNKIFNLMISINLSQIYLTHFIN